MYEVSDVMFIEKNNANIQHTGCVVIAFKNFFLSLSICNSLSAKSCVCPIWQLILAFSDSPNVSYFTNLSFKLLNIWTSIALKTDNSIDLEHCSNIQNRLKWLFHVFLVFLAFFVIFYYILFLLSYTMSYLLTINNHFITLKLNALITVLILAHSLMYATLQALPSSSLLLKINLHLSPLQFW